MSDQKIYRTGHWKRLRKIVLKRCGGKCERCGRELAGAGHLHHKTYERAGGHELETDVEMLCLLCHGTEHPSWTFLAPVLHLRRQEERPLWRPKSKKPYRFQKQKVKKKKAKRQRPVEAYWDEINGAAYARVMELQAARKEASKPRQRTCRPA